MTERVRVLWVVAVARGNANSVSADVGKGHCGRPDAPHAGPQDSRWVRRSRIGKLRPSRKQASRRSVASCAARSTVLASFQSPSSSCAIASGLTYSQSWNHPCARPRSVTVVFPAPFGPATTSKRGREAGAAVIETCRSAALAYLLDRRGTLPSGGPQPKRPRWRAAVPLGLSLPASRARVLHLSAQCRGPSDLEIPCV